MKAFKILLLLAAAITTPAASAATIQLSQGGWDLGGPLTITFAGEDTDLSGGIETWELTSFTASFLLPTSGTATWSLPDLGSDGFFWGSTADYFIKADNVDFSLYETSFPGGSIALISDSLGSFVAISGDPLQAVPEPETAMLFSLAILGSAFAVKFRRA